jgi:hypothetical protein
VNCRRGLLLVVLIYVALDFSLPEMPGAFVFDPAGSVESVEVARGRLTAEIVVLPAPAREALIFADQSRRDSTQRLPPTADVAPHWRPVVNWLVRATLPSSHISPEDPH